MSTNHDDVHYTPDVDPDPVSRCIGRLPNPKVFEEIENTEVIDVLVIVMPDGQTLFTEDASARELQKTVERWRDSLPSGLHERMVADGMMPQWHVMKMYRSVLHFRHCQEVAIRSMARANERRNASEAPPETETSGDKQPAQYDEPKILIENRLDADESLNHIRLAAEMDLRHQGLALRMWAVPTIEWLMGELDKPKQNAPASPRDQEVYDKMARRHLGEALTDLRASVDDLQTLFPDTYFEPDVPYTERLDVLTALVKELQRKVVNPTQQETLEKLYGSMPPRKSSGLRSAGLTFDLLRIANRNRLPQFKNSKGEPAHSTNDGHDWNPAQWLQAVVGELGEYAEVRMHYENGQISYRTYCEKATKELADVQIYLDILALRAFDTIDTSTSNDCAQVLQTFIAHLGNYANNRKKFERGDIDWDEFDGRRQTNILHIDTLMDALLSGSNRPPTPVLKPHAVGVDLGRATIDKFNEVSDRVGANVKL